MPTWTALVLLLAAASFTGGSAEVDWEAGKATCRVVAAADPTRSNLSAARLGAERMARERAKACLLAGVSGLSLDGERTVAKAAAGGESRLSGAVEGFEVAHASYGADGSVGLVAQLPLASVAHALSGAVEGPVRLSVDARGLKLPRALVVKVVDPEGRTVFSGPATYGKPASGVAQVSATGVLSGGVSSVIVSAAGARKIKEAHLAEGGVRLVVDD